MNWFRKQLEFMPFGPRLLQKIRGACLPGEKHYMSGRAECPDGEDGLNAVQSWHDWHPKARHQDSCGAQHQ